MPVNFARIRSNCRNLGGLLQACNVQFDSMGLAKYLEESARFGQQGTQTDAKGLLDKMEKTMWGAHSGLSFGSEPNATIMLEVGGANFKLDFADERGKIHLTRIGK